MIYLLIQKISDCHFQHLTLKASHDRSKIEKLIVEFTKKENIRNEKKLPPYACYYSYSLEEVEEV